MSFFPFGWELMGKLLWGDEVIAPFDTVPAPIDNVIDPIR
jgi:hypothetical protein